VRGVSDIPREIERDTKSGKKESQKERQTEWIGEKTEILKMER
jgi:hypothetical protein